MSETLVACCALAPRIGEVEANRETTCAAIAAAAAQGARVVVLPELASSGYVFRDAGEALALAEPADGPTVSAWAALAAEHDLVVVGGFCERDPEGRLRNSAVLIDGARGVRAVYRKVHLWDAEKLIFEPGDQPPPVVETPVGRIAVMVCYDLELPEWVRLAALAGADLLCVPVNWPAMPLSAGPRPAGERPGEVIRAQAFAGVNRMFIAVAGRVGAERGVDWVGGTVIVDADGHPLAGPSDDVHEGVLAAACALGDARRKRISEHNDVLADRRPELYGPLAGR
ncbi:MAG TPA: nitrilase-related carbon-nitrogen hydrolase [Baekduia sp.]|nr:nitrilase-related carbon-nitrogen hydrolase [Baekduia sp.]